MSSTSLKRTKTVSTKPSKRKTKATSKTGGKNEAGMPTDIVIQFVNPQDLTKAYSCEYDEEKKKYVGKAYDLVSTPPGQALDISTIEVIKDILWHDPYAVCNYIVMLDWAVLNSFDGFDDDKKPIYITS